MSLDPSEDTRKELEEIENLELGPDIDFKEGKHSKATSKAAWQIIRETDQDYSQREMEELVSRYQEHFDELENDYEDVIDYLEQFDKDIEAAIDSFEY